MKSTLVSSAIIFWAFATHTFGPSTAGSIEPHVAAVGAVPGTAIAAGVATVPQLLPTLPTSLGLLKVYDSKNVVVGPVIGYGQWAVVSYNFNRTLISLQASRSYLRGVGNGPYFTTPNCSGAPYMLNPNDYALPESAIAGTTLYLEDTTAPITSISTQSVLTGSDGKCVGVFGGPIAARPALIISSFTDQFTPPFTVR